MAKIGGLGRGLDALFEDNSTPEPEAGRLTTVRLSDIEPNKEQPRGYFDSAALAELAESIKENGLLQPIVVRPKAGGVYQIIAGERRWRACRMAGLSEVSVIVMEADDARMMELALLENLQREDLTPLEEARGYRTLMERCGMTQEQVAQKLGKSRPAIANSVRLLSLPEGVQSALEDGRISAGHARVLAGLSDAEDISTLCYTIIAKGLSVRQTEQAARAAKKPVRAKPEPSPESAWGNSLRRETELSLQEQLGRKVTVTRGAVAIEYFDEEDLKELAAKLGKL